MTSVASLEKHYAEIAAKTAAAIAAEGPPHNILSEPIIQNSLPQLPRYIPPPPIDRFGMFANRMATMHMFFPTSGRLGFDTVKSSTELPPIEILREMILYETRLRLSDSIQNLMDEYHTNEADAVLIVNLLQKHVVEYFGYTDVNILRSAQSRFPDDSVVQETFYIKHNKVTQGLINQGECARDVNLYTLDGQLTNLFSRINADQPLIIVAGSIT
ncbi:hypothetical protein I4U23_024608 [Adineta vaga]|nr:hypothetical protein I4U23_024608 [Adineta vaga]